MARAYNFALRSKRVAALAFVFVSQAPLLARAGDPLPEFYGLYAVDNGRLVEISSTSTGSPTIGSDVTFIYFAKGVAASADAIRITRAYFIRNWVYPGFKLEPNNQWTVIPSSPEVALRAKPVPNQAEMTQLVPREPLTPGAIYTAKLSDGKSSSFTVRPVISPDELAKRDFCVDVSVANPYQIVLRTYTLKNAATCATVDCLLAGRPKSICAQQELAISATDGADHTAAASQPTQSTAASTQPNATGRSAQYENCISMGTAPESCDILYPIDNQEADAASGFNRSTQDASAKEGSTADAQKEPVPGGELVVGTWRGSFWSMMLPFDAAVQIDNVVPGQFAGRTEYKGAGKVVCRGALRLLEAANGEFTFEEKKTEQFDACPIRGQLRLRAVDSATAEAQWLESGVDGKPSRKVKLHR